MKWQIPFIISLLFFLVSCDDDPELPDNTTTGENTFGYVFNGEIIEIKNTHRQVAIYQGGFLQFGADHRTKDDLRINLGFLMVDPIEVGVRYSLTPVSLAQQGDLIIFNSEFSCDYECLNTTGGYIELTNFDKINYTVSGKFEYSASLDGCDDIVITDGRFDLDYIP